MRSRLPKIEECKSCGTILCPGGSCPNFDCHTNQKERSYVCPDPECNKGMVGRIIQRKDGKFFCDKCGKEFIK